MLQLRKPNGNSRLLTSLSLPIFALIVGIIVVFATAASYMLIRVQNEHTQNMAEQSIKFVYRNVWYQFDTMNNVSSFIISSQSIENLLESTYAHGFEAVDDFYTLQSNLQNLSLLSLLKDSGSANIAKQSYVVSVAFGPGSGLYEIASEHFYPATGIYKNEDFLREAWFQNLSSGERKTVWWGQKTAPLNAPMMYLARTKSSIKDGRSIGTVIVGADTQSIKAVFDNAPLDKGYYMLLDDSNRVIYSERHAFLADASGLPQVQAMHGPKGTSSLRDGGENQRVMFETLDNGWKLLAVVPERHFSRYTFAISAVGAATAAVALLIAGLWLRRIVIRVTVPITKLVTAMQRPEVAEGKEPLPSRDTGIYEVDELSQKFASMLSTLQGLIEKSFAEEMERRQLQLELLHAQINPHFLYNTLDLINCRAILTGDRETSEIVRALASVFRFGLNRGEVWIPLGSEMKQVDAYLHIQQMMVDGLQVEIHVPDELLTVPIVHFILQPLAENAIIHGFAQRTTGCRITISARMEDTTLVLRVADNGQGCDVDAMNAMLRREAESETDREAGVMGEAGGSAQLSPAGYGTINVHRRIQLYCGEAYGLRYVEASEGTCVEVLLPYRLEPQQRKKELEANV
ncbi:cache domain-containing sensor histidine kinase [Paenibacillus whitsoniae]|uniref:Sensor histidine kinase n=1 Tax=Paenibacillus whitsoniae TaxID=2496558 RepID=A0A3S0A796_9BACL|nr:histidine kinase [Paenibacillus whitsoniae]RTE03530.1 sensor histidine kinase [Paenibacillus whitsoniae]